MSSMWRASFILPALLVLSPSSSAQTPPAYAPAPAVQPATTTNIAYALNDWRRLRQSSGYAFADYARFLIANPGWPDEFENASLGGESDAGRRGSRHGDRLLRDRKAEDRRRLRPARRSLFGKRPDGRGARRGAQCLGFRRPRCRRGAGDVGAFRRQLHARRPRSPRRCPAVRQEGGRRRCASFPWRARSARPHSAPESPCSAAIPTPRAAIARSSAR